MRVGAARSSHLVLSAPGVLPTHFFLKLAGGRVALIVQDPAATVTVNGAEIRKRILESGDTIRAGDAVLTLEAIERDMLLGETVGGYRIESLLGKGGMGTVYKATQLSLERDVALKILSPELTLDESFVNKFLQEARAAAKLNHSNVVQVHDAAAAPSPLPSPPGTSAQLFYFSMEFMPGGTLQKTLDQGGRIAVEKALQIGCDAARALAWAEERGIVHRDIKPANLLFAADGSVKVADLGIAADIDRMMEGVEVIQGAGSPRYMAPEQAQRKAVDHRADIYALGATLFRSISGRHVFEGESITEIVKAKLSQDPPRLDSVAPDTPGPVADLINRMLSRDPAKRPRSCAETLAALEASLESLRKFAGNELAQDGESEEVAIEPGLDFPRARKRSTRSGGGWNTFLASGAGKANLTVSSLLVLLAVVWPMSPPPRQTVQRPPEVPVEKGEGQRNSSSVPAQEKPATPTVERKAAKGGEGALDPRIASILKEYRSGLIDVRRAIAALEAFKRLDPTPAALQSADTYLAQIRDNAIEAGKTALSQFQKGELPRLVEASDYREVVSRLTKMGAAHPLILQEVNDEAARVEVLANAALKEAEEQAQGAAAVGDFSRAKAILAGAQGKLPDKLADLATAKLKILERDERDFVELAGPLSVQVETLRDAILALDFEQAVAIAAALPKPASPALIRMRQDAVNEAARTKAAFSLVSAAALKAGKSTDPFLLFTQPAKELVQFLGAQPANGDLEGLGLLVLHFVGPDRAREILLDPRLGAARTKSFEARLASEEDLHLARLARSLVAKVERLKKLGKSAKRDWEELAASLLQRIRASRNHGGYALARADLARAFLEAKAEVLRHDMPQSLFKGKVKSYKPDGSIELLYDFKSADQIKDFVPVRSTSSRLELEGRMAKLMGECRLGKGDVFRNRLGVTAKVPSSGFTAQSPNLNVALWTRDNDRVSPPQKQNAADELPEIDGKPDDYFVFAIGYSARLPLASFPNGLVVRGGGTSVSMPAIAILGGLRGEPLHSAAEGDCLWGKPLVKISGSQTFKVTMTQGAVTWASSSQTLASAKELREIELFHRDDPYLGSVTLFTNSDVLLFDSISVEGELNPAWVDEQLILAAEFELKKVEPN